MKKIERLSPPDCLDNDIKTSRNRKIRFYENLKDKYGDIRPRWNTTCKDEDGISRIRKQLSEMSDGCCGYCGDKLTTMSSELLEWEGDIETLKRLEKKLTSLKEISFEYE